MTERLVILWRKLPYGYIKAAILGASIFGGVHAILYLLIVLGSPSGGEGQGYALLFLEMPVIPSLYFVAQSAAKLDEILGIDKIDAFMEFAGREPYSLIMFTLAWAFHGVVFMCLFHMIRKLTLSRRSTVGGGN